MVAPAGDAPFWALDFEFNDREVICLVARNLQTGETLRYWQDQLAAMKEAPFPPSSRLVAFYASAELGCFLKLGWKTDYPVIDVYVEFRRRYNGKAKSFSLLGVVAYFGLPGMADMHKSEMRELALRGSPFTEKDKAALLAYCQSDVDALAAIWPYIAPELDLPRAELRGRYMAAAARIEHNGIPVDSELWTQFSGRVGDVQTKLIQEIDASFGVYDNGSFRTAMFLTYLEKEGIPWPSLDSGAPKLDRDTFAMMALRFPQLGPLANLRRTLGQLRAASLEIGADSRARCLLSAFASKTSRNQPSTSKFVFGFPRWARGFIKPGEGQAVAYVDWSQQEFGIAAALSGDSEMMEGYRSGDPYLMFAKQAGAVPEDATKGSHPHERAQFKACVLATQYGQGPENFGLSLGISMSKAQSLLDLHRRTYSRFWAWSDRVVEHAMWSGKLSTVFGWDLDVGTHARETSLRNFPMQANGAEMLRLACILATEAGIRVSAPVHDALLIESSAERIDEDVRTTQEVMRVASRVILDGFELETDATVVSWPDRFEEEGGREMWDTVVGILDRLPESHDD
jgi:hypothetical protein